MIHVRVVPGDRVRLILAGREDGLVTHPAPSILLTQAEHIAHAALDRNEVTSLYYNELQRREGRLDGRG